MNSNTQSTTNVIGGRELRSKTKSTISFQAQSPARSTNRRHLHDHSKSTTTTASPILGRKISKQNSRRSNSVHTTSISSKTKKSVTVSSNNDEHQPNEPDEEMDYHFTEQTTTSSFDANDIISDPTINDDVAHENDNENGNDQLNCSNETVDEVNQIKRTTTATKKDIMKHFTKQSDGGFKCNLCSDSDKVSSPAICSSPSLSFAIVFGLRSYTYLQKQIYTRAYKSSYI
jgi:hypothetical protein